MSIHHGYAKALAITPSDSVNLPTPTEAIYVGGAAAADIAVVMSNGGNVVLFQDVPIGTILPVKAKRVNATGTGALDLVGLWGA